MSIPIMFHLFRVLTSEMLDRRLPVFTGELICTISSCHYVAEILLILALNTIQSIMGEGAG
jgi:hypothetical protein